MQAKISDEIQRNIIDAEIQEVNNLLLKHYLINQVDIRGCPNQNCNYSGFVMLDPNS